MRHSATIVEVEFTSALGEVPIITVVPTYAIRMAQPDDRRRLGLPE
jgi:hypothetical protein